MGRVPAFEDLPLQTDWLRLKGHIVDPATGLPTLAAVLDDVRRLLERGKTVVLIYLDLGGGMRVESQHGWQAYDETVKIAALALRAAREQRTLALDVMAVVGARSDKFVLFVAGAPGETLETAEARAVAVHDAVARPLHEAGRSTAVPVLCGASLLHRDPMLRAERSVHRALDDAMFRSQQRRSVEEDAQARWLEDVIRAGTVVSVFQPIVDLGTLDVIGQEVFTHGPVGGLVEDADALFALAERSGRAAEFERLCRRCALRRFPATATDGHLLFLKISPAALHDAGAVAGRLAAELQDTGFSVHEVVIEVEERLAALDRQAFHAVLHALKGEGFRIAIDDMGAGYSSLQSIAEMEPDFLKFDMSLVRHLDRSPIKRSLLETVVRVSDCVLAPVIAEGIETAAELATIREMGVPFGQGRHLSPERPPESR